MVNKRGNIMLRLQEIREERNILQKDLANRLDKTRACISSWETGKTEPDIESLIKIADILDVSLDYLLGRSDDGGIIKIETQLSGEQKELLELFGKMSTKNRNQLLGFAKALVV